MSQIAFQLRQLFHRMWFLPAAFSLLAVASIMLAYGLARFAPEELPFTMPSNAVVSILTILASSMLTVAVFALSTIVSALSTASSSATPRAVPLIVGDRSAQTSISVFIGAFLFSIVGIIGLNAGFYSEAGRLLLFAVALLVVVLVVAALIRWIGQISAIGRVVETINRVESATDEAFAALASNPGFGCMLPTGEPRGRALGNDRIGYVQHVDAARLQAVAEEHDLHLAIIARPGAFVGPGKPLLLIEGASSDEVDEELAAAFTVGDMRTFDSDPRFGIVVLSEIASKALSPGINDAGTAIDVIGTLVRVLHPFGKRDGGDDEVSHDRVSLPPLDPADLIEDGFRPIARDGAGTIEVVQRLMAGLHMLALANPALAEPARAMARDAAERARQALTSPSDLQALERAAAFATGELSD
jgi:uncharacterized membrane protein